MQVEIKGGDLETAIHRLKRFMSRDGLLAELRLRGRYPNLTDRRKAKARQAARRRGKLEKRKAAYSRDGRESSYDYQFRKQDQANRIFALRRSIATDPTAGNR